MREFFRGWKRRVGVVTLLMACGFMAGWVRSGMVDDWIMININANRVRFRLSSANSRINILRWTPEKGPLFSNGINTASKDRNPLTGRGFRAKFDFWDEFIVERRFDWAGFHFGSGMNRSWHGDKRITIWLIPYWSIVLPLTALAAFLLLSKPRQSTTKKITEPTANEEA